MFRRAVFALVEGVLLAVVLSALIGWIAIALPFHLLGEIPEEVMSRTRPSPFDLGIAVAAWSCAAYALAQPALSAALPGVAIATALMPPVCVMGIGIALSDPSIAFGAGLLFFTNLAAISFAGIVVFVLLGFRPIQVENAWHHIPHSLFISAGLVLLIAVPLVVLTVRLVEQAQIQIAVREVVKAEISSLPDGQLVAVDIDRSDDIWNLRATVRTSQQPIYRQVVEIQKSVVARLQRTIAFQLIIIPTTKLDPLVPPTLTPTYTPEPSFTPTSTLTPSPILDLDTCRDRYPDPDIDLNLHPHATPVFA